MNSPGINAMFLQNLQICGVVIVDSNLELISVNDYATWIFSYQKEEMIGQRLSKFIPECDELKAKKVNASVHVGPLQEVLTGYRQDQFPVPLICSLSDFDLEGKEFFVFTFKIDESYANSDFEAMESRFRQMSENVNDIFWVTDLNGATPVYVSLAYEKIYGYSLNSLFQNPRQYYEATHPDDRRKLADLVRKQREVNFSCELEYRIINSTGQVRWLWARLSKLTDAEKNPIGICGVTADITERKLAEIRVNEFHSTISHELRTPLTSIKGSLGLIAGGLAGDVSPRAAKLIQIGLTETDRLIRLVNDLLDIKKIEEGQFQLDKSDFEPQKIIDLAITNSAALVAENGIAVKTKVSAKKTITGDLDKLLQVTLNLLSNAIKFSSPGENIELEVADVEPNKVRFVVRDNGPGIRADDVPKLFQRFQQLDQSDTRAKGGTGLGLAISKAIIEQHKGTIGVADLDRKGATFWFEIPTLN